MRRVTVFTKCIRKNISRALRNSSSLTLPLLQIIYILCKVVTLKAYYKLYTARVARHIVFLYFINPSRYILAKFCVYYPTLVAYFKSVIFIVRHRVYVGRLHCVFLWCAFVCFKRLFCQHHEIFLLLNAPVEHYRLYNSML